MRNSTPIILWVLIFSFGVLWVLQDTQVFDAMAVGPRHLGAVNGEQISLEEFNTRVSYYVDRYNEQSTGPMPADMRSQFEQQAWEDLVAERLMAQKMDELGITVTDEELVGMITGENPDPFIRQQFADENGNIDRIALRNAIEAPENREVWMMIEQQLKQNRRQQKMSNFIMNGLRVSNNEIEQAYMNQNSFADASFVRFPYGDVSQDEMQISESDLRNYYDNNRQQFFREETYRFRYVAFDKTPTREDTLRIVNDVEELRGQFADAVDDSTFLQRYQSIVPYRGTFVEADEIRPDFQPVIDLEIGEVSEVHMVSGDPHIFKKIDERNGEIKFGVLAFNVIADPIATIDRLAEEADEFSFFAQEDGFVEEAERQSYEVREATATKGTPVVPGLGQARALVNQLESMRRGNISGEIELQDYFVVAQLMEVTPAGPRPLSEVRSQVENIVRNEKRKEITVNKAEDVRLNNETLDEIAEASGKEIQRANNIRMGSNNISGAGREPGVIGAIFGLQTGELSRVIEGNNAAFVVLAEEIEMADPSEMTTTERRQIRQQLEQQKFAMFNQVWIDQLKAEADIRDNRHVLLSR